MLENGLVAPVMFTLAVDRNEWTFSSTGSFSFEKSNRSAHFSEGGPFGLSE